MGMKGVAGAGADAIFGRGGKKAGGSEPLTSTHRVSVYKSCGAAAARGTPNIRKEPMLVLSLNASLAVPSSAGIPATWTSIRVTVMPAFRNLHRLKGRRRHGILAPGHGRPRRARGQDLRHHEGRRVLPPPPASHVVASSASLATPISSRSPSITGLEP